MIPTLLIGQFVDAEACQAGHPVGARLGVGADLATIAPTVRHATRIKSLTAFLDVCTIDMAELDMGCFPWMDGRFRLRPTSHRDSKKLDFC